MKKPISFILAAIIALGALSGCGGSTGKTDAPSQSTSSKSDAEASTSKTDAEIPEVYYEGFLPMRVFENRGDSEPEAYAEMEKMIIDAIGVKPVPLWMPRGSEQEKLNLLIASQDDKLDIIMSGSWQDYNSKNVLLPLNDLLDTHGKDILDSYKDFSFMWDQVTSSTDKKIYGVPRTIPLSQHPIWVREDWATKVGQKTPTNIDELDAVLKAFKEQDPAGNGQTIPMLADLSSIEYGFSGGYTENGYGYWQDTDGKVKPGVMQPGFKDSISKVADWYKKGYIYPETFTIEVEKTNELIQSGRVGSTIMLYSPVCINLPELQKTNSEANYAYTDGFAGPKGICETGKNPSSDSMMILKKSKNPEAAMKLLNWMMDKTNFISSYAGREGTDWDWVDKEASTLIRHDAETYDGEFYMFPNNLMLRYLNILDNAQAKPGLYTKFLTEDSYRTKTVKHAQDFGVIYPVTTLDEISPNRADVDRMIEEELVKFITGIRPMADWDNFINNDLKKAGVDAVIEARTKVYTESKK